MTKIKHPINKFERKLISEKKKAVKQSEGRVRHQRVLLKERETSHELEAYKGITSLQELS